METAEVIRNTICKGEWVVSIDLTDAYFHIPIHKKSQHLLRFHVAGRTYQFRGPSIRNCYSPSQVLTSHERGKVNATKQGKSYSPVPLRLVSLCPIRRNLPATTKATGRVCSRAWVGHQFSKIRTKAYSKFRLPGLQVRSNQRGGFSNRKEMAYFEKSHIYQLQNSLTTTPRVLMSFIGVLASLKKTVPMGMLHMRPFQWYLKDHWKYPQSLDMKIPCSKILKSHLT